MIPKPYRYLLLISLLLTVVLVAGFFVTRYMGRPSVSELKTKAITKASTAIAQIADPTPTLEDTPVVLSPGSNTAQSSATPIVRKKPVATEPFVFYNGGNLNNSWADASWSAKADFQSNIVQRDTHSTLQVTYQDGWGAFSIADTSQKGIDSTKYSHLHFWIRGGEKGGQAIGVFLYMPYGPGKRVSINRYIPSGGIPSDRWQEVFIPLSDLETYSQPIFRIAFQDVLGRVQPSYYLDGIELYDDGTLPPEPKTVQAKITIDTSKNRQPISPLIYGMSFAPEDVLKDLNIPLNRWGGNGVSRCNWVLGNACNAGSDWEFRNTAGNDSDPAVQQPSGAADKFYRTNRDAGSATILTIPTLGFVAKDSNNNSKSVNVPDDGGNPVSPGSEAIPGYDPTQNQNATSVRSYPRKGQPFQDPPTDLTGPVYQDEWINHLVHTFGTAANGGVQFYAMDNEPDLWSYTHRDIHPVRVGYDDLLKNFLDYATAVKDVDPTAQVTGPVLSGWTAYWYSALDRGNDNFKTAADRRAHGMPLLPWFLDQVRKHDEQTGRRSLDVLDIHYYPQGVGIFSDQIDQDTAARRLRATRSLWDPTYTDESWIASTKDQHQVQLIPLMKKWIDLYYPGTKLGITEWNFGADKSMNGALAIADVLGIYGREGVYLANYWTYPQVKDSPGQLAFKMYRNYDGQKSTFGDVSVSAQSSNLDQLAVYASDDTQTNQTKIVVINKSMTDQMATHIDLQGTTFQGTAKVYQLSQSTNLKIQALPEIGVTDAGLDYTFAPYSITLLVIDHGH